MHKLLQTIVVAAMAAFATQAESAPLEISVGFGPPITTPYGRGHEQWAKLLGEQSNGTMKLNLFPSDQLGNGKQMIDQMLINEAVIFSTDTTFYADLGVPDVGIVQAPYLFTSWEQADKLFDSDWWKGQEALLEKKGIKVLAHNWRYGDRHTITTKLVLHPADFKGLKIRVPQAMVFVKAFEAIGASPTPMALGEVYTSLQQGVIDGLENPLATIDGGKYQEVAKYLLLDSHMKTINLMTCGAGFFKSLKPEQQQLLMKTAREAGVYQNKLVAESDSVLLAKFKSEGVTVNTIQHEEFAKAAERFYSDPAFSKWTPGLYQNIRTIMNR
jgi:TRAP-type transport system periplasmic protein